MLFINVLKKRKEGMEVQAKYERVLPMNQLILVMKDEDHQKPQLIWKSNQVDDKENNELFEQLAAQFDEYKVEAIEKNEPFVTLQLEPVEANEIASYSRDFSIDAEKKDLLLNQLKKSNLGE